MRKVYNTHWHKTEVFHHKVKMPKTKQFSHCIIDIFQITYKSEARNSFQNGDFIKMFDIRLHIC